METKVKQYININEILSRLMRNPLCKEITKEQVIQYVVDFIAIAGVGFPMEEREDNIKIEDYRGLLPCDIIKLYAVKDLKSGMNLRAMTDDFLPHDKKGGCCNPAVRYPNNFTFRIQGRVIYTSIKCGVVRIDYVTIKVDEDGFPFLIDNPLFLKALEDYIKVQYYEILFEQGKMQAGIFNHAEQNYYKSAARWRTFVKMPTIAEMESIKNMMTTLLQRTNDFRNNWRSEGDPQLLLIH